MSCLAAADIASSQPRAEPPITNHVPIIEHHPPYRKRMSDSLFQFFCKYRSKPLFSTNLISSSFLVCFKRFETWWVHHLRLYKISVYSKGKDVTIKDLKLKIVICFPVTHHRTLSPLTPNIPYFTHSFTELRDFCNIGSASWRNKNVHWASE